MISTAWLSDDAQHSQWVTQVSSIYISTACMLLTYVILIITNKWTYPVEYLNIHLSYITQIKLPTDNITDIGK